MASAQVRDLVRWTVQDPPPELVLGRALGSLLRVADAVSTLGAGAAGARATPSSSVPDDPEAFVDIGPVRLAGTSSWLAGPGPHRLAATREYVWLLPRRGQGPTHRVPLEALSVTGARTTSRSRRPRHARAPWTLELADAAEPGASLTMDGAWLALAWIGYLAAWPEPDPTP